MKRFPWILIFGDALALAVVVALGLRSHEQSSLARLPLTWLPYLLAWLPAAWVVGAYEPQRSFGRNLLGPLLLGMLFASPLASVLRAAWLGTTVQPLFVLIMAATGILGLLVWRLLYGWLFAARDG